MPPFKDVTGHKYGSLTAIKFVGRRKGNIYWTCRCECGHIGDYHAGNLQSGRTRRCLACRQVHLRKINWGKKQLTYQGETKPILVWAKELGVKVATIYCRRYRGLPMKRVLTPGKLDPIQGTQITFRDKTQNIARWAREIGITREALRLRLNSYGWTKEQALTLPTASRTGGRTKYCNGRKEMTMKNKGSRTQVMYGWGLRVGGPRPYLASRFGYRRCFIESVCTESYHRPVRVVLVPQAEYDRLKRLDNILVGKEE